MATNRFDRSLSDRALRVLRLAADVYHDALPSAPEACRYMRRRGVGGHAVHWAHVGYATGRDLLAALNFHGIATEEARAVGLLNEHGSEVMRGRITVPVIVDGRVLTMTGRAALPRLQRRYLDLPLPPHALGVDFVRDQRRVVLVEGVTDYLVALEWRIPAISAMGTHASPEVRTEIRDATLASEVIPLALDNDEGGAEAVEPWVEWLGPKLAPVIWPSGINDVGDLGYMPKGAAIFRQMLTEAEERWWAKSTLRTHSDAA